MYVGRHRSRGLFLRVFHRRLAFLRGCASCIMDEMRRALRFHGFIQKPAEIDTTCVKSDHEMSYRHYESAAQKTDTLQRRATSCRTMQWHTIQQLAHVQNLRITENDFSLLRPILVAETQNWHTWPILTCISTCICSFLDVCRTGCGESSQFIERSSFGNIITQKYIGQFSHGTVQNTCGQKSGYS